jgi:hypothetical protein
MLSLVILHDVADPEECRTYSRRIEAKDCDELYLDALGWLVWKPKGKPARRVSPSLVRMVVEEELAPVISPSGWTLEPSPTLPAETFEVVDRHAHYSMPETEEEQPALAPPKKRGRPRKS